MWQVWDRKEVQTALCTENLKQTDDLEDPGIDVRIILKWALKTGWEYILHSCHSEEGPVVGSCEHCTEPWGSLNGGKLRSALFWDITLRNIPEEHRSHQHCSRSLKSMGVIS
jgi:hypothetical protein